MGSEEVFPVCYSDKHLVNSSILFENRKDKVFENLEHLPRFEEIMHRSRKSKTFECKIVNIILSIGYNICSL